MWVLDLGFSMILGVFYAFIAGVPNLWPVGQKWPAKPQKVALDLSKNKKKNIYEK